MFYSWLNTPFQEWHALLTDYFSHSLSHFVVFLRIVFWFIWGLILTPPPLPPQMFFWYCIKCNVFLSFTTNPFLSLLRCTVKQPLVCFICFLLYIPSSFSLIVSCCWALPPLSSDDGSSSRCWYNEEWQDGRALFLPNGPKSDHGL